MKDWPMAFGEALIPTLLFTVGLYGAATGFSSTRVRGKHFIAMFLSIGCVLASLFRLSTSEDTLALVMVASIPMLIGGSVMYFQNRKQNAQLPDKIARPKPVKKRRGWNRNQVVVFGLATLTVAICLFPHWRVDGENAGYRFILWPPSPRATIDFNRIQLQLFAAAIMAGAIFLISYFGSSREKTTVRGGI